MNQAKTIAVLFLTFLIFSRLSSAEELTDFHSVQIARYRSLIRDDSVSRRLEGVKGLSAMKHWPSEEMIIPLLGDSSFDVRREAVIALTRLGTAQSIPHLIGLLNEQSWELRTEAQLCLRSMTAQSFQDKEPEWSEWWRSNTPEQLAQLILHQLAQMKEPCPEREQKFRALRHFASIQSEGQCDELLRDANALRLTRHELDLLCGTLERIGNTNSIPALARFHIDAAAWAIGTIGGPDAEAALLQYPKTFPVLLNLDRVRSTNAASFLPHLIHSFGLATYRAHPDDLQLPEPQPDQQVAANLILRSGLAPVLIEATLRELEATMVPPVIRTDTLKIPPDIAVMLKAMREELKPGFVRGDGETITQPVVAMYHLVSDPALVPRLSPLLRHPAIVPRIYIAMVLGKLKSEEALPDLIRIVREGYGFSDATALASGKHFDQSQTVRWRGFLCMAMGKIGSSEARRALEQFASDPNQPRDVRYGAVVGLGFILDPESEPVLQGVAAQDLIWMVQDEARAVLERLADKKQWNLELARTTK